MRTRHFVAYQRRIANAAVGIVRCRKPVSTSYRTVCELPKRKLKNAETTAHRPPQHNQLMPQCRILCLKSALRLERRGEQGDEEA
jgi:hypothetical protein